MFVQTENTLRRRRSSFFFAFSGFVVLEVKVRRPKKKGGQMHRFGLVTQDRVGGGLERRGVVVGGGSAFGEE